MLLLPHTLSHYCLCLFNWPPGKTVAVIGPHYNAQSALAGNYLGQLCPDNTENCIPSLLEEIDNANTGGKTIYSQGSDISSGTQKDIDAAVAVAKQADLIVSPCL